MTSTQGTNDDRLNLTRGGSHAVKAVSLKVEDGELIANRHQEVARLRAVRIEPTDRSIVQGDESGSGLTQASPFVIRFSFSSTEQAPPPQAKRENDSSYVIESFGLQRDLEALLMWAQDEAVQLQELSAGPHRALGAVGAAGFDHAVA